MRGGGISRGAGSFGARSGAGFSGFRGGIGRQPVFRGNYGYRGYSRFGNFGYYPGFYGGYGYGYGGLGWYDPFFYSDYDDSYSSPYPYGYSDSGYGDGGYGSSGPPVVIVQNPTYAPPPPPAPVMRYPPGPQLPGAQQQAGSPLFLVAFQDGVIRAVLAYWVDGATLHYVTMDHEQKQAPLSSVDRPLSERLNGERNVQFSLPR